MKSDLVRAEGLGLSRWCVVLAGVAGLAASALGDDDDQKLLDRQPPVVRKLWRNADPWKLLSLEGPILDQGDTTFDMRNVQLLSWIPVNNFPGFGGSVSNQSGADC
jgi:hypothetical protein